MSTPQRKLQDLLNNHPTVHKNSLRFASLDNQSFQNIPADPCSLSNQFGSLIPGNIPFKNLSRPQNLFYHPAVNRTDNGFPSPMIHLAGFQTSGLNINNNAMFYTQSQSEQNTQTNAMGINLNNELLNSLSSECDGVKMFGMPQPKTLNELLKKSLLSTQTTSILQSQVGSGNPSQLASNYFMSSPCIQPPMTNDFSSLLTPSVMGTPIQNSQTLRNQMPNPQPANNNSNEGLLFQLAGLLKQENGRDIKMALAELIHKYNGPNNGLKKNLLSHFSNLQGVQNAQGNQKTIPLANGFIMNSVNRDTRSGWGNNMRSTRQLIMLSEPGTNRANYSVIPEEDSTMLCDHSNSQGKVEPSHNNIQPPSPNLNQELNLLNINAETQENHDQKNNTGRNNISTLPVDEELATILEERLPMDTETPGTYTREERKNKILKYKNKIRKWRTAHPVNRSFKGRSVIAGKKPRIKGKFVTIEEYVEYIKTTNHTAIPQGIDRSSQSPTCAGSEKSNKDHELNVKEETY